MENFSSAYTLFARTDPAHDKLKSTCVELVALLTRFPDPGVALGDDLRVSMDLVHYDAAGRVRGGPGTDPLTDPSARCGVVTPRDRTLSASLVGLGDQPIPWT